MTWRSLAAAALVVAALPATQAQAAPNGPLAQQCGAATGSSGAVALCYGGDVLTRDAQAYAQPDRFKQAIDDYQHSWTHRALGLQYELANDVGFANAPWPGTHNSFNSIAEEGSSLSDTDANQQLKLTDQLQLDMRSLELDVHWFPSWRAGGQDAPVVCHAGAVSEHDGCSTERLLGPILDELAGWLDDHKDQVLLLYIEDHISGGYDVAASTIEQHLASRVYRTGATAANGNACTTLPLDLTRDDVLAAGAQVVIVSGCGSAPLGSWHGLAFDWSKQPNPPHVEDRPHDFQGLQPDGSGCGPGDSSGDHYSRATYDSTLVRYYEDSTWLTTGAAQFGQASVDDGLTPDTVRAMVGCGVDLFGFDQLTPGDGRNDALVWSWAKGQPRKPGDCAAMGGDGRWRTGSCTTARRVACRTSSGDWFVPPQAVSESGAASVCAGVGAQFAVPRTGYENGLLQTAAGGAQVLLGYVRSRTGWRALDTR